MHNNWEIAFIEAMESESQSRIEDRIANNLAQLQSQDPWRVSVEAVEIVSDSRWTGKEIKHIDLRRHTGTTIAGIERSGFDLTDIQPHSRIFPHDKLFLLGEPAQIAAARRFLNQKRPHAEFSPSPFVFTKQIIPPLSPWIGQPIKDTRLRSDHGVTIVGIQRASERVVSPNPDEVLREGDLLLIMGTEDKLASIKDFLQKETHDQAEPSTG